MFRQSLSIQRPVPSNKIHLMRRTHLKCLIAFLIGAIHCHSPITPISFAQDAPAEDAANNKSILSANFIYESAPFPSCHASSIEETANGLIATWFGGTHEKHPDVGIWVSRLTYADHTNTTPNYPDKNYPDKNHAYYRYMEQARRSRKRKRCSTRRKTTPHLEPRPVPTQIRI